ncbi:MAG: hypothetical protein K0R98_488 [Rickettsiaceae bacterium]|jgi:hypothetical protein|nr:hypothetical protein [Rickettsiaceae bacterium]
MTRYKHREIEYHPKDTSFEVEAMLMADQQQEAYNSNSNDNGYVRDKERSFNAVTDIEPAKEHIKYEHKRDALYNPELDFANEKRGKNSSLAVVYKLASKSIRKGFSAVIQSMLLRNNIAVIKHMDSHYKPKSFLNIKEVDKALHIENIPHLRDVPHPHIDALNREHGHNHEHGRQHGHGRLFD